MCGLQTPDLDNEIKYEVNSTGQKQEDLNSVRIQTFASFFIFPASIGHVSSVLAPRFWIVA